MKIASIDLDDYPSSRRKANWLERFAQKQLLSNLERLETGQIEVLDGDSRLRFGSVSADSDLRVSITVNDPAFYSDIAFGGSVGSAESYMRGEWHCTDLQALIRILLKNRHVLEGLDSGSALLKRQVRKGLNWINRNSRKGSRRNIAAHYDLGNEFYSLWLDDTMMYSAAFYETPDTPLEDASVAKLERICKRLDLQPDDHVMEVGTGWGGFALHAAGQYGCKVTTTTISREQFELATQRVRDAGLADRVEVLFKDYRDLDGRYDKLVSIEMIEAVGHEFHEQYFGKCAELLKPDGEMLLQAITIDDGRYESYKKNVDFIKRYIFPGGCLTSITAMADTMTRTTDLRIFNCEDIGAHYATTLRHWHDRFFECVDEVRSLGFSSSFVRMWQFYLCYCEAAFRERAISDVQLHLVKPDARPAEFGL